MKVLKHGDYLQCSCPHCGCEFKLEKGDYVYPGHGLITIAYCPECSKQVPTKLPAICNKVKL